MSTTTLEMKSNTILGASLASTAIITFVGMNAIDVLLGCASSLPSSCVSTLVLTSSPANASINIDVNDGVNNMITVGSSLNGLDSILGNVEIDGAVRPGACASQVSIDHTHGSQVTAGILYNADIHGIGAANPVITYYQVCSLDIQLSDQNDNFNVNSTHNLPTSLRTGGGDDNLLIGGINGNTTIMTEGGDDHLSLGVQDVPAFNRIRQPVILDGGHGSDIYSLFFAGVGSSIIMVDDSSALGVDNDQLNVLGTPSNDMMLFRVGVMAMINPLNQFEMIHYTHVIASIAVDAMAGNDEMVFDDVVSRQFTASGGLGDDRFIVGQLYNAPHDQYGVPTVLTTRGYLSNGCTVPLSLFGGDGNDGFLLQHNLGVVFAFGEAGIL
jgi:hypothetical protein